MILSSNRQWRGGKQIMVAVSAAFPALQRWSANGIWPIGEDS